MRVSRLGLTICLRVSQIREASLDDPGDFAPGQVAPEGPRPRWSRRSELRPPDHRSGHVVSRCWSLQVQAWSDNPGFCYVLSLLLIQPCPSCPNWVWDTTTRVGLCENLCFCDHLHWPRSTRLGHLSCYWPAPSRQNDTTWPLLSTLWNSNWGSGESLTIALVLFILRLHLCVVGGQGFGLRRGCVTERAGEEFPTGRPHSSSIKRVSLGSLAALFPPCPHFYGTTPFWGTSPNALLCCCAYEPLQAAPGRGYPTHVVVNKSTRESGWPLNQAPLIASVAPMQMLPQPGTRPSLEETVGALFPLRERGVSSDVQGPGSRGHYRLLTKLQGDSVE